MFRRWFASFLSLLILWSGFATQGETLSEARQELASLSSLLLVSDLLPAAQVNGSVDDHHVDDQPGQAQPATQFDHLGAVAHRCLAPSTQLAADWNGWQGATRRPPHHPPGLFRPPIGRQHRTS